MFSGHDEAERLQKLLDKPAKKASRKVHMDAPTPLIQIGKFTLNSGKKSEFKLVCDQFIRDNLDGLVHLIRRAVGPFGVVQGIPRGGCLLAEALAKHKSTSVPQTLLLVDDVLTTGGSMRRAREQNAGKCEYIIGAVVFSRGPCPMWITPLLQLPEALWRSEEWTWTM